MGSSVRSMGLAKETLMHFLAASNWLFHLWWARFRTSYLFQNEGDYKIKEYSNLFLSPVVQSSVTESSWVGYDTRYKMGLWVFSQYFQLCNLSTIIWYFPWSFLLPALSFSHRNYQCCLSASTMPGVFASGNSSFSSCVPCKECCCTCSFHISECIPYICMDGNCDLAHLTALTAIAHSCALQLPLGSAEWPGLHSAARKTLVPEASAIFSEVLCKGMRRSAWYLVKCIPLQFWWFLGLFSWQVWFWISKTMSHDGVIISVHSHCAVIQITIVIMIT